MFSIVGRAICVLAVPFCVSGYAPETASREYQFAPTPPAFDAPLFELPRGSLPSGKNARIPLGISVAQGVGVKCLERNNHYEDLRQSQVWESGQVKFRIDGWSVNTKDGSGHITIRSNAPGFNRRVDLGFRESFSISDSSLCPGTELTARCQHARSSYDTYWNCRLSAF